MPAGAMSFAAKFLLLFGGIWMAVGLPLTFVFLLIGNPFWVDWRLDESSKTAEATVLSVTEGSSRSNQQRSQVIEVRFIAEDGQKHVTRVSTFDEKAIARAHAKKPVRIEYDPEDPSISRLKGGSASLFGYLALIPVPFAVVGLAVFFIGLRKALDQREIYRNGRAILATVSDVTAMAAKQNRRRVMRAHYGFTVDGKSYEGAKQTVDPPAVGESIWVLYDPSQPQRNVAA